MQDDVVKIDRLY